MKRPENLSRRNFIRLAGLGLAGLVMPRGASAASTEGLFSIVPAHVLGGRGKLAPSDTMNIGCVGVGGMQGMNDVMSVATENIYALCDVDEGYLNAAALKFPKAKLFRDFRQMLDQEHHNLDGITITIPDHMHATVALWAMERGLAVYCQKPLAQTVWEVRQMAKSARKYQVVTQMGNQGYSAEAMRVASEILWRGDIGEVREVHGLNAGGFSRGVTQWPDPQPVPSTLDWDLWTGRAAEHPYHKSIAPINWRGFLEYGTQMVGDWGVHIFGAANFGLQLGAPTSVECTFVEGANLVTYPSYCCKLEFPERPNPQVPSGKMPPVTVYWYEGSAASRFKLPDGITNEDFKGNNSLLIGSKGCIMTSGRSEGLSLWPNTLKGEGFKKPEKVIRRSPGHFKEWIQAVKGGPTPCSNFEVASTYAEWLLLATISWRFPNQKMLWDATNMRFTNNELANSFLRPTIRKGWEIKNIPD